MFWFVDHPTSFGLRYPWTISVICAWIFGFTSLGHILELGFYWWSFQSRLELLLLAIIQNMFSIMLNISDMCLNAVTPILVIYYCDDPYNIPQLFLISFDLHLITNFLWLKCSSNYVSYYNYFPSDFLLGSLSHIPNPVILDLVHLIFS